MAKKVIGWTPNVPAGCAGLEFLLEKPESVFSRHMKNTEYRYKQCPSTLELARNTFVVVSPFDGHFKVNADTQQLEIFPPYFLPQEFFHMRPGQYGPNDPPLMSLNMHQLFITEEEGVEVVVTAPWFERNASSQFVISPGRVDISKWWRPLDCAFQLFEREQEVRICRGDPLFYISVRTGDPSDVVVVKEIKFTPELELYIKRNTDVKHFTPQCPLKSLYSMATRQIKLGKRPKLEFLE